jgi:hypothetical protein
MLRLSGITNRSISVQWSLSLDALDVNGLVPGVKSSFYAYLLTGECSGFLLIVKLVSSIAGRVVERVFGSLPDALISTVFGITCAYAGHHPAVGTHCGARTVHDFTAKGTALRKTDSRPYQADCNAYECPHISLHVVVEARCLPIKRTINYSYLFE